MQTLQRERGGIAEKETGRRRARQDSTSVGVPRKMKDVKRARWAEDGEGGNGRGTRGGAGTGSGSNEDTRLTPDARTLACAPAYRSHAQGCRAPCVLATTHADLDYARGVSVLSQCVHGAEGGNDKVSAPVPRRRPCHSHAQNTRTRGRRTKEQRMTT